MEFDYYSPSETFVVHPRKPRGYWPGRCNIFERAIFSGESLL